MSFNMNEKQKEIYKVTHGWVTQIFDQDGKFLRQEFFAGDIVEMEDEYGEPIDEPSMILDHPFDMVQGP
jgi:hypothetical protein